MTVDWSSLRFNAFPPFSIILKILKKIEAETADDTLTVPTKSWFPLILKMLTDAPVLLISRNHLLHLPPTSNDTGPHMEEDRFAHLSLSRFFTENSGASEETTGIIETSWKSTTR